MTQDEWDTKMAQMRGRIADLVEEIHKEMDAVAWLEMNRGTEQEPDWDSEAHRQSFTEAQVTGWVLAIEKVRIGDQEWEWHQHFTPPLQLRSHTRGILDHARSYY